MEKKIFAGNWKMNHLPEDATAFAKSFLKSYHPNPLAEVVIFPQAPLLNLLLSLFEGQGVKVGAQDCAYHKQGAYTGDISPELLSAIGCDYSLIGHSERRNPEHGSGESDLICAKKISACLEAKISPMLCVGESKEERKSGKLETVLKRQITEAFAKVSEEEASHCSVAYEPLWAIGTGETATSGDADNAGQIIRNLLIGVYSQKTSEQIPILYGGSVKPENSKDLLSQPQVNGLLIGGSSLKPESLLSVIQSFFS